MRKFLLAIIAVFVGVSTLAACSTNGSVSPFKLTGDLTGVTCENRVSVSNALSALQNAEQSPDRDDALKAWGFDSTVDPRIATVQTALRKKGETCNSGATDSPESEPGDNGTATVTDDGKKSTVPLVDEAPKAASADTTSDPMTPASLPAGLCPTLVDWSTLVDCVEANNLDWYVQGVNQREKKTGFDWSDIKHWAEAKNADTAEVRAIEVFGKGISDKEARSRAAELVGEKAAKALAIVRQPACFNNTRGLEAGTMQDFVYCPPGSRQVRVSLLPATMKNGKIVAIRDTDSGVFVDCDNLWWIPEVIKTPGNPPQVVKPKKKSPPKADCPPGQNRNRNGVCVQPKDARQGTEEQGNNRPGGGGKAPKPPKDPSPPKAGKPPKEYEPPAKPTPKPTPRPTPPPTEKPDGPPATEYVPECPNPDNPACG